MAPQPGFVGRDGTRFVLYGTEFPVVGVNCYFLGFCGDHTRTAILNAIKPTGANVIRAWAFFDSHHKPTSENDIVFQYWDGNGMAYNDGASGLRRLDTLIHMAEQYGFRLILPLVNYWNDYGGMRMYVDCLYPDATRDLPEGEAGEDQVRAAFYTSEKILEAFQEWVKHVLTRVNSITGKAYKDSPAILGWELANEPRCTIENGHQKLEEWVRKMSQYVKELDSNHLLALGDEGFFKSNGATNYLYSGPFGSDFDAILALENIDFGTYHFYPAPAEMGVPLAFGNNWIEDHIASGERASKPVLMEEYGVIVQAPEAADPGQASEKTAPSAEARNDCYARWLKTICDSRGAGDLLWMIGSHEPDVTLDCDAYTVYSAGEIPFLPEHADAMRSRATG